MAASQACRHREETELEAGLKQGTWIRLPEKQLSLGTVFWGRAYKELVACPFRQLSFSLSAPPLTHSIYLLFAS